MRALSNHFCDCCALRHRGHQNLCLVHMLFRTSECNYSRGSSRTTHRREKRFINVLRELVKPDLLFSRMHFESLVFLFDAQFDCLTVNFQFVKKSRTSTLLLFSSLLLFFFVLLTFQHFLIEKKSPIFFPKKPKLLNSKYSHHKKRTPLP